MSGVAMDASAYEAADRIAKTHAFSSERVRKVDRKVMVEHRPRHSVRLYARLDGPHTTSLLSGCTAKTMLANIAAVEMTRSLAFLRPDANLQQNLYSSTVFSTCSSSEATTKLDSLNPKVQPSSVVAAYATASCRPAAAWNNAVGLAPHSAAPASPLTGCSTPFRSSS